jgi:site-specific recombinase XerC
MSKTAGIPRHISPHSLHHAAITNTLDAVVPLRDAQILAGMPTPASPSTTTAPMGNPDRHGFHFITAYVAGV